MRRSYAEAFRDRLLSLAGTMASLPLAAAVGQWVRALVAIHAEDPGLHNAVSVAGIDGGERRLFHQFAASWLEARSNEVRRPNRPLAATIALDAAESLIHGVALRHPKRLDEEFAAEVTDLLTRYLAK